MVTDPFALNGLLLSLIIFLPIIGSLFMLLLPESGNEKKLPQKVALGFTFATFFLSLIMAVNFKPLPADATSLFNLQFVDKVSWIPFI
jgi:NADH:ubiquinone oxidoreductase subunit 4 (subunit M)